jgi:hypothetical protein
MEDAETHPATAERLLATLAQLCKDAGLYEELWVLTLGSPELTEVDRWDDCSIWNLTIGVPADVLARLGRDYETLADAIFAIAKPVHRFGRLDRLQTIEIIGEPMLLNDNKDWRATFQSWLSGQNVSNQGRAHSKNIAPREHEGLLFRSTSEIYLYDALKQAGILFAPLPTFIKRDQGRVEPDFFIVHKGFTIVEIDGPTHRESPVIAHRRLQDFTNEPIHVERIGAEECDTLDKAQRAVQSIIRRILNRARGI